MAARWVSAGGWGELACRWEARGRPIDWLIDAQKGELEWGELVIVIVVVSLLFSRSPLGH